MVGDGPVHKASVLLVLATFRRSNASSVPHAVLRAGPVPGMFQLRRVLFVGRAVSCVDPLKTSESYYAPRVR